MHAPPQTPPNYIIGFNLMIDRGAIMRLLAAVGLALDQGARAITLCVSSPGGVPEQAFYAYEILRALPVPLTTHNVGTVQSAAVTLFLAGKTRYAVPNANFLVHQTVFRPMAGTSFGQDHLANSVESIGADDDRAMDVIVERTGQTLETVRGWFEGQKLRSTAFAKDAGFISDVRAVEFVPPNRFFQVLI